MGTSASALQKQQLNLLLPIDPQQSELSDKALAMAVRQARDYPATLHVVTVLPSFNNSMVASYFPKDAMEKALKTASNRLSDYLQSRIPVDVQTRIHVTSGNPYKQVLKLASDINAELIIIPSHKHGKIDQLLLGSVTAKVVEGANCSVLVVRSH